MPTVLRALLVLLGALAIGSDKSDAAAALCGVHVCPDGHDASNAPEDPLTPLATLGAAQSVARLRSQQHSSCAVVDVVLCPDLPHVLRETLVLTEADSNTVWRSGDTGGAAAATISGAVRVNGWTPVPGKQGLVQAVIPTATVAANTSALRHLWRERKPSGPAAVEQAEAPREWTRLQRTTLEGLNRYETIYGFSH
jgi:hypothetical protein